MKLRKLKLHIGETIMLLVCMVFVIPLYYLVVCTFKTEQEMSLHPLALPSGLFLDNYINALSKFDFMQTFGNTLYVTILSVILVVVLAASSAYVLARKKDVKIVSFCNWLLFLGFLIPGQATMIPMFRIMKGLGLINKLNGLIFLHSGGCVFGCFMYKGFIKGLSKDFEEAAKIDGAGTFRCFWQIVFPLLKPITTTLVIFRTMDVWNDFLTTYLYINSTSKATLTLQVYNGVGQHVNDWGLMMATLCISLAPIVIFYLLLQKHIVGGMTMGGMKD